MASTPRRRGDDAQSAVGFEDGEFDLINAGDLVFAQDAHDLVVGDAFTPKMVGDDLPVLNQDGRDADNAMFQLGQAQEQIGDSRAHEEERSPGRDADAQLPFAFGHCVLDGVGKEQDCRKVINVHLAEFALAGHAQADDENDGDQSRANRDGEKKVVGPVAHSARLRKTQRLEMAPRPKGVRIAGDDADRAVNLQNAHSSLRRAGQPVFAEGGLKLFVCHALAAHPVRNRLAAAHDEDRVADHCPLDAPGPFQNGIEDAV